MFKFSAHSKTQLATLHPKLQAVLREVLKTDDFKILEGGRTPELQQHYFDTGRSTLKPPDGNHLIQLDGMAYAADLWPYIGGKGLVVPTMQELQNMAGPDFARGLNAYCQFAWFIRRVMMVGKCKFNRPGRAPQWKLRSGMDWDGDNIALSDQTFQDFPHIEIKKLR